MSTTAPVPAPAPAPPQEQVAAQQQQQAPTSSSTTVVPPPTTETTTTQQQPPQEQNTNTTNTSSTTGNNNNDAANTSATTAATAADTNNTTTATAAAPTTTTTTTTATSDPEITKLETEVADANKEINRLTKECEESEKEAQNASLTSGSVKQKVRELSDQVTTATRVRATLKKEHDELTAAVEHGKANTDLNQRSANSKSLIVEYEERLAQLEAEDVRSKDLLESMAAQYKRVAERKKTALERARTELAELETAIKLNADDCPLLVFSHQQQQQQPQKSADANNESTTEEDPAEQLDILADLASNREFDLRDAERQLRETEAIVQLKEEEIVRLQAETAQRLEERRKERDEEIKRMVFGFQDDRKALHDDIAEMRRANADQKLKLVRGHVQDGKRSNGDATEVFLQSATRSKGSPRAQNTSRRDTHLKPKVKKSIEEVHLEEHNAEIEDDLRAALHALAEEQKVKSEIAKNTKSIQERMKKDDLMFSQKIMQLQAAAAAENARARKAENENEKLCADVSHFSEVLENTRRNIERVRGHSAPLPVE